ncbi:MAG: WD40 repeat domain-containing protein [Gemmataceae bacterium]|nr:WD40 repeat domain-containing protein [Gemmataceae bacterium]
MFTWNAHEHAVTALAFAPDGRFLVSAGADQCVRAWDPLTGAEQSCIPLNHSLATADLRSDLRELVISRDGTSAAIARPTNGLIFLDLARARITATQGPTRIAAVRRCPDGDSVLVLGVVNHLAPSIARYQLADGLEVTHAPPLVAAASLALAFSPDGAFVAVGKTVHPWQPRKKPFPNAVWMKNYEPDDLAFSADNAHLFARVGGKVVVYKLPDGLYKTKLKGHCGPITAMALTPDGSRLWTASRDATVRCWDTHTLTPDRTYTFQTGGLDCLAVSPDGNVAAVGSGQKGTITLWDLG